MFFGPKKNQATTPEDGDFAKYVESLHAQAAADDSKDEVALLNPRQPEEAVDRQALLKSLENKPYTCIEKGEPWLYALDDRNHEILMNENSPAEFLLMVKEVDNRMYLFLPEPLFSNERVMDELYASVSSIFPKYQITFVRDDEELSDVANLSNGKSSDTPYSKELSLFGNLFVIISLVLAFAGAIALDMKFEAFGLFVIIGVYLFLLRKLRVARQ